MGICTADEVAKVRLAEMSRVAAKMKVGAELLVTYRRGQKRITELRVIDAAGCNAEPSRL